MQTGTCIDRSVINHGVAELDKLSIHSSLPFCYYLPGLSELDNVKFSSSIGLTGLCIASSAFERAIEGLTVVLVMKWALTLDAYLQHLKLHRLKGVLIEVKEIIHR